MVLTNFLTWKESPLTARERCFGIMGQNSSGCRRRLRNPSPLSPNPIQRTLVGAPGKQVVRLGQMHICTESWPRSGYATTFNNGPSGHDRRQDVLRQGDAREVD